MSYFQPRCGEANDQANAGADRLIDAWVRRELADAYDRTLGETLPEDLLNLAMLARPRR
jgi:hypothetical protein